MTVGMTLQSKLLTEYNRYEKSAKRITDQLSRVLDKPACYNTSSIEMHNFKPQEGLGGGLIRELEVNREEGFISNYNFSE